MFLRITTTVILAAGLLTLSSARACDEEHGRQIRIVRQDLTIEFANTTPVDEGWVEARAAGGQLDTAAITIDTERDIVMSYRLGSDFRLTGGAQQMPLQFAARVQGRGQWGGSCGGHFNTRQGFTDWTAWQDAGGRHPYLGVVQFDKHQVFTLEIKARTLRSGLADPAGYYTQPQELTITFAPSW